MIDAAPSASAERGAEGDAERGAEGDADVAGQAVAAAGAAGEAFGPEQAAHARSRERQPHAWPSWIRTLPRRAPRCGCQGQASIRGGRVQCRQPAWRDGLARPTVEVGPPSASASRKRPAPDAPAAEWVEYRRAKRGAKVHSAEPPAKRGSSSKGFGITADLSEPDCVADSVLTRLYDKFIGRGSPQCWLGPWRPPPGMKPGPEPRASTEHAMLEY